MELLGDLERTFATSLYPLRVPIAIGLLVAVIAVAIVARRGGWVAAARRRPLRSGVIGIVVVALVLPTAWYLGSPLLIRTSLEEPAPSPVPQVSSAPSTTSSPLPIATPAHTTAPLPEPTQALAAPRSGMFTGADDFHFGRGSASLIETAPGAWVVRFEDFSVRNGPDLYVYLSPDPAGYAPSAVELGRLKATDGSFNTKVPAGIDVASLSSVVIWCKQFAVQFAVAPLA